MVLNVTEHSWICYLWIRTGGNEDCYRSIVRYQILTTNAEKLWQPRLYAQPTRESIFGHY
jgi:hypothetical protein